MLNWDVQDVRRYKDKPFEFEEELDLTKELTTRSDDVLDSAPVEVKGQLFNDHGLVISDVKVKTTLKVPSTRSLLPVELPVDIRINEAYNIDDLAEEDLEDYAVVISVNDDNPTINIYESVIDNILLSIPSKVLTKKEEQENIMPSGKDWEVISEEDFNSQKEEEHVNPEFAKLKGLFKDDGDKK
ncbi:YceD family protein [Companilactobacillus halodurans]|uniref:DUF177 domain-containing protein n=1 Tax=Companilactobacillus halodurans TaxID=2584183 RepID=A0A5P0ZQH0_9LACO|nr:YceD family protein [Companilactobacillus halodurans]MQS76497.1 hypothetical protein [Companilactobacillus halodurans]MQS97054.1 hypothetical protein [Companilactobacillus halodurans]